MALNQAKGLVSLCIPYGQITDIDTEEIAAYVEACGENLISDHIDHHDADESYMVDQNTIEDSPQPPS